LDVFDFFFADNGILSFRKAITEKYDPLRWDLVTVTKLIDSPLVIVERWVYATDNNGLT
jgi:hypothetical protein